MACTFELESRSVKSFRNLYKKGNLNLTPVFQRQSVWKPSDREKLINSIYKGFPLPAIFEVMPGALSVVAGPDAKGFR